MDGAARRERPLGQLALLHALLHEREAVVLVVDREVRRQPDVLAVLAEDAHARRVEGGDERRADADGPEQALHPPGHLAGGLVGERDGEEIPRGHALGRGQPRDAVGDDPRLAAARAGEDEERPFSVGDGFALGGVQIIEETFQTCRHRHIVPGITRR